MLSSTTTQRGAAALTVLIATACGPDTTDLSVPTCDEDGPVQLLEYPEGTTWAELIKLDDQFVVNLSIENDDPTLISEAWLVESCGGSSSLLGRNVHVTPVGDILIGRRNDGGGYRIDPDGGQPVLLFPSSGWNFWNTPHGVLAIDPETDALLLHREPEGEARPPETLLESIAWAPLTAQLPMTAGDHAYALNAERELLQVDLATGQSAVFAEAVVRFWLSPGGQRLLWREWTAESSGALSDGPVHLSRPETGEDRVLVEDFEGYLIEDQVQWPYAVLDDAGEISVFDLRDGTQHPVSLFGSAVPVGVYEGGLVIATPTADEFGLYGFYTWRGSDGALLHFVVLGSQWPGLLPSTRVEPEGLLALHIDQPDMRGELLLHPFDSSSPHHLASDVSTAWLTMTTGEVVWSNFSQNTDDPLPLVEELRVQDPDHGETLLLSDPGWLHGEVDSDVVYSVFDGEQPGLWRTALP